MKRVRAGGRQPRPALAIRDDDQADVAELYRKLRRSRAKLVGPDGQTQGLPEDLYHFLVQLIAHLVAGRSVSIIQSEAQLTTVEAANMLGVSRGFLIKLLQRNEIPHHMVGTHRRIYARDILEYKTARDGRRRTSLRELAQAEMREGLYDRVPPHDQPR
jgi:excisionase family DNA binding protein